MRARETNLFEKAISSTINLAIVFLISTPLVWLPWNLLLKKLSVIAIFFIYNLVFLIFNENRCPGMIVVKTYWSENYKFPNKLLFAVLYTLSFSSLFFWVFFPFDLFLLNMIFLQLPTILITGKTLHGFLSGNMSTVKISD